MARKSRKVEPYWLEERDWLVTLAMVDLSDQQDRAECGEWIGYLFGYAFVTNTRCLALVGDPSMVTYELLFSFESPEQKRQFLKLANGNDLTRMDPGEWMVPTRKEIRDACPLGDVIPRDLMMCAAAVATWVLAAEGTLLHPPKHPSSI